MTVVVAVTYAHSVTLVTSDVVVSVYTITAYKGTPTRHLQS